MSDLLEQEKKALRRQIEQMIANGVSDDEIIAHRDAKLADIEGKRMAVQQRNVPPVQQEGDPITESPSARGSSDLPLTSETEYFKTPEAQMVGEELKDTKDIGAWENFNNNVQNVFNRIYGFDDRLALAAVDTFENLLGKEGAAAMYKALPTKDTETGQWLTTPDEVRAAAYREIAETNAANKQTIGLIDAWEEGSVPDIISAAAGAGLNMMSTLLTSGLTLGAGLYTDMVGDAVYDANKAKADELGISIEDLYDTGQSEFAVPAMVGTMGGMLEKLGAKGTGNYIGGVAKKLVGPFGKKAFNMAQNMGGEGMTEWLQTGLENYNREYGAQNEDAAEVALTSMFSREGLEAALQGAIGAGVGGGAGKGGRYFVNKIADKAGVDLPTFLKTRQEEGAPDVSKEIASKDNLFDGKDNDTKYKSQQTAVEEAQAYLDQEFEQTQEGFEKREKARETIQEAEQAKRTERTEARKKRAIVKELKDEYDASATTPNEMDKTLHVARGLAENYDVKTLDQALEMAGATNGDAKMIATKAFISARSKTENERLDFINENLADTKKSLETKEPGPGRKAMEELVAAWENDLQEIYSTANKKAIYSDPKAIGQAIDAQNRIQELDDQKTSIEQDTELDQSVKDRILANIEDNRAQAVEDGENARKLIEESSTKNLEASNSDSRFLTEVLNEELNENTKPTNDFLAGALDAGLLRDPEAEPVIDETFAKTRQPIKEVDGVKHYGERLGGIFGSEAEAQTIGQKLELEAEAKGYKVDVTYTDVNTGKPGGETRLEMEVYKPREGNLDETVEALRGKEQQAQEKAQAKEAPAKKEEGPKDEVQEELDEAAESAKLEVGKGKEVEGAKKKEEEEETPGKERTVDDYVKTVAKETGAEFTPAGEGVVSTQDERAGYRLWRGLREKRGHEDADIIYKKGVGAIVKLGTKTQDTGIDYQIDQDSYQNKEVAALQKLPLDQEGGATFNQDGTQYKDGGLAVPVRSEDNIPLSELTPERIEKFKKKYADFMGPATRVGIYKFPGENLASIDLNVIASKDRRAEALEYGKRLGQESLFDLDSFENIKTGEDGKNTKTITAKQAREISEELAAPKSHAETTQRKDVLSAKEVKDQLKVDPDKIFDKAKDGQSYVKVPFGTISTEERADLAGGKGGFGSAVDKEAQAKTASGRNLNPADFMKIINKARDEGKTGKELKKVLADHMRQIIGHTKDDKTPQLRNFFETQTRWLAPYGINSKFFNSDQPIPSKVDLDDAYDKLAGYKGASNNLENDFRIATVNTINQPDTSRDNLVATEEGYKPKTKTTKQEEKLNKQIREDKQKKREGAEDTIKVQGKPGEKESADYTLKTDKTKTYEYNRDRVLAEKKRPAELAKLKAEYEVEKTKPESAGRSARLAKLSEQIGKLDTAVGFPAFATNMSGALKHRGTDSKIQGLKKQISKIQADKRKVRSKLKAQHKRGAFSDRELSEALQEQLAPFEAKISRLRRDIKRAVGVGAKEISKEKGKLTDATVDKWYAGDIQGAIRDAIPYISNLTKRHQRGKGFEVDADAFGEALAAVSEAFTNGYYKPSGAGPEAQGRLFDPENASEMKKELGGIVQDAILNYNTKVNPAYGVQRTGKAGTRLNKIKKAIERLRNMGEVVEGVRKVGGKGKRSSKKYEAADYAKIAEILNEGFDVLEGPNVFGRQQGQLGKHGDVSRFQTQIESLKDEIDEIENLREEAREDGENLTRYDKMLESSRAKLKQAQEKAGESKAETKRTRVQDETITPATVEKYLREAGQLRMKLQLKKLRLKM